MPIVHLKHVRLSFPDLFVPGKPMKPNDPPKYGAQFIMEKGSENEKAVKAAMAQAAQETFGPNWAAIVGAMEKSKKCLRDGNTNLDSAGNIRDGYKDMSFVSARNKAKPAVVDAQKENGAWRVLTAADGRPYGGCIVNAKIDIQAMKGKEQIPSNIYASLQAVQYVSKGKAFGASPGTPEGFDEEEGEAEDDGFGSETSSDTSNGDDPFA